ILPDLRRAWTVPSHRPRKVVHPAFRSSAEHRERTNDGRLEPAPFGRVATFSLSGIVRFLSCLSRTEGNRRSTLLGRSDEESVGKECVRMFRYAGVLDL